MFSDLILINALMLRCGIFFLIVALPLRTVGNAGLASIAAGLSPRGLVPSREWLEFEGGVISALFQQRIGVSAPMEITP